MEDCEDEDGEGVHAVGGGYVLVNFDLHKNGKVVVLGGGRGEGVGRRLTLRRER